MSLIVDLVESIKKYIGNDNYVCSVFIDFEKGFDTADQQILLQKLYHYGIPGLGNNWFRRIKSTTICFYIMFFFRSDVNQMWSTSKIYI